MEMERERGSVEWVVSRSICLCVCVSFGWISLYRKSISTRLAKQLMGMQMISYSKYAKEACV
jgi:hypothetical protein